MFEILQMLCGEPEIIKHRLREIYGERPTLEGQLLDGRTFEFWFNPTTRTWTIIVDNRSERKTCIPLAGTNLEWGKPT